MRAYSSVVDTMRNFPGNFERITYDGRAIATSSDSHQVEIGVVHSLPLFQKIFEGTAWNSKHSEGGRLVSRIVEMLGGPQNYPGNQPAIRRVLDEAAKSTQGRPLSALIQSARSHKGEWPGDLTFNAADYPKNVVYYLLNRKLLQPFLEIRCPHCAMKYLLRPGDLAYDMECEICTERFPLGLALGLAPGGRNDWVYKLTGNISADRIAEIVPVAGVLSVMTDTLNAGKGGLPHIFGLVVEEGKWKCEIDIMAMADWDERPVVVIGEVKSYRDSIDRNDLSNLVRVQEFVRSQGFECLVLAATLREKLTDPEVADLRDMCQGISTARRGNRVHPLLPIILTGADLSVPRDNDTYPARWGSHFDLLEFAEDSCRRNIGLVNVRSAPSGSGPSEWAASWQ